MTDFIKIYRLDELESIPEPSWLIEDILHRETLSALVASRGGFKTFLALDWGLCIATGLPWNGHSVAAGNVLHIVGEGGTGIRKRAQAWYQNKGINRSDIHRWACTVHRVDIVDETEWLVASVENAYRPADLELIVVDTLARNSGADENNTKEMSRLIVQADYIKDRFHANVLFVHHNNRAGSFRGSSALDGAFQTVVAMERKGDSDNVLVRCEKQKDAEEFDKFVLKRKKIYLPFGRDSIILEMDADSSPQMGGVLKIVDMAGQRGVTHQDAMQAAADANLCKSTAFNEAWSKARQKELIVRAEESPPGKGALWIRNLALIDLAA